MPIILKVRLLNRFKRSKYEGIWNNKSRRFSCSYPQPTFQIICRFGVVNGSAFPFVAFPEALPEEPPAAGLAVADVFVCIDVKNL